jgi:ribosomal protein S18 acetylase RimI-like enzyme
MLDIIVNDKVTAGEIAGLRESVGWKPLRDKFEKALENTYLSLSVKADSQLIAFLRVISDGSIHAYIADFVVHPSYQNKGIGSKLLDKSVEILKERDIEFIELTFKEDNLYFYKNAGLEINLSGRVKKLVYRGRDSNSQGLATSSF